MTDADNSVPSLSERRNSSLRIVNGRCTGGRQRHAKRADDVAHRRKRCCAPGDEVPQATGMAVTCTFCGEPISEDTHVAWKVMRIHESCWDKNASKIFINAGAEVSDEDPGWKDILR